MGIALKELRRRPARFLPVGCALTLLVVLLVVLGGFLDGLEGSQTGAYRAHEGRLLVFSDDAELQLQRSLVPAPTAAAIAAVDGVGAAGPLLTLPTTAGVEGREPDDVVVFGYEVATDRIPAPSDDGVVIDRTLAELQGLATGDVVVVGPQAVPLRVGTVLDDLTQGAPTVWVDPARWREIAAGANPAALRGEGTSPAVVVAPATDTTVPDLAARITGAVDGVDVATPGEVIGALEVVQQQSSTFQGILVVTFVVTLLVVALFFALITLERIRLYAVLKAVGARTVDLLVGLSAQAVAISVVALVVGFALAWAFVAALPPDLPIRLLPARLAAIAVGTVVTALVGTAFTLRRITSIDPAQAIG